MADPIAFSPYLGWEDAPNPNEPPPNARMITAEDLLRYERFGASAAALLNSHTADITTLQSGLLTTNSSLSALSATLNDTATGLAMKAPLASPTFTGTVSGITKAMVGLGNVDNTSDANKPVSTAVKNAYVPRWKAATAYAAGEQVISPLNEVVSALSAHTSAASFDPTKWKGAYEVPFGHAGRSMGFQAGAGNSTDAKVVITPQKLRGGMTFNQDNFALVVPRAGYYNVRVRAYFSGTNSDVCLIKPRFKNLGAGVSEPAEASGNWASINKTTGAADIHYTVDRDIPLPAGAHIEHWFMSNQSTWGTDGYNGTWIEARYIGPLDS